MSVVDAMSASSRVNGGHCETEAGKMPGVMARVNIKHTTLPSLVQRRLFSKFDDVKLNSLGKRTWASPSITDGLSDSHPSTAWSFQKC